MEKWELDLDKLLNSGSTGNYKYCHVDQLVLGVREAKCEEVTWNYFTHVHFSNVYTEEKKSIAYETPDGSENKITIWSSDNKHRKKKLYASHYVMTKERFLQCVQSAMSSGVWNYTDSKLKATNPIDEPISANIKYVPEIDPTGSGYDLVVPMEESLYGSNFRGNYYIFEIYAHGSHLKKMLNADDQKKIQQELEKRKIRYRLDRLTDRIGNIVCKFENEVLDMTPKRLGGQGIEIYFQLMENITSSVGLHIHTEQEHDGLVYECRDKSVELLPNERIGVVVAPNQSKTTITITDTETGLIQFRYRADRSLYSSYRGQISFPKRCFQIYQDGRRIVRDGKEQNVQLDDTQHFGTVDVDDEMLEAGRRQQHWEDEFFQQKNYLNVYYQNEHTKALQDIKNIINDSQLLWDLQEICLIDPYLSSNDILDTVAYCQKRSICIRCLTDLCDGKKFKRKGKKKNKKKHEKEFNKNKTVRFESSRKQYKEDLEVALGMKSDIQLSFRTRSERHGSRFHDRYLILKYGVNKTRAWSLGTSVNSVGKSHHIIQIVEFPTKIEDFFDKVWGETSDNECKIYDSSDYKPKEE